MKRLVFGWAYHFDLGPIWAIPEAVLEVSIDIKMYAPRIKASFKAVQFMCHFLRFKSIM